MLILLVLGPHSENYYSRESVRLVKPVKDTAKYSDPKWPREGRSVH